MAVLLPPPLPFGSRSRLVVKVKIVSEVECDTGRIKITLTVKRESAVVSIVLTTFLKFLIISEHLTCLVAVGEVQIRRKRYRSVGEELTKPYCTRCGQRHTGYFSANFKWMWVGMYTFHEVIYHDGRTHRFWLQCLHSAIRPEIYCL